MANATILYWNINNFTDVRISTKKRKFGADEDEDYISGPPGPGHLAMMLDTFRHNIDPATGLVQTLDFIVVVEVYNRNGAAVEGDIIDGSGLGGCTRLLRYLRVLFPAVGGQPQWSLVPPVVTGADGQREGIAVFYRSDRWYFLGPTTRPAPYAARVIAPFLPDRNIPAGYPYIPAAGLLRNERRRAGQWQFRRPPAAGAAAGALGAAIDFPNAGNRKPWLTAFGNILNPNLLVRLLSIHTQPDNAHAATRSLAAVQEMTTRPPEPGRNQIDVILGDFNVDNLIPATFQGGGSFGLLMGLADPPVVPPPVPPPPLPVAPPYVPLLLPPVGLSLANHSYYETINIPRSVAAIVDEEGIPNFPIGDYPGYRYTHSSVDNALVRYRNFPLPGPPVIPPHRMTIVNRVTGSPYNAPPPIPPPVPPPPPLPDVGYYRNNSAMNQTIAQIFARIPGVIDDDEVNLNDDFREPDCYGLVRRVSDHFPLLFDI